MLVTLYVKDRSWCSYNHNLITSVVEIPLYLRFSLATCAFVEQGRDLDLEQEQMTAQEDKFQHKTKRLSSIEKILLFYLYALLTQNVG